MTEHQDDVLQDMPKELLDLFRFTMTGIGLGIPVEKMAGDFRSGLEDLRQNGVVSLEQVGAVRARTVPDMRDLPEPWVSGFVEGYLAAWAAAMLRVLDIRGVEYSKELYRAVHLCRDASLLTRFLERAVTATREGDLVAGEPGLRAAGGS